MNAVRWPTSTDYTLAVQSPAHAFRAEALRGFEPVYGTLGVPMSASGQNATVFLLRNTSGQSFALRCFTRPALDARARYEAYDAFAARGDMPWLATAHWLSDAFSVGTGVWPVILMPWVSGSPLNVEVADSVGDSPRMDRLVDRWTKLVTALDAVDFAHGDLQHGNVLVDSDLEMRLVDLDGVWLPAPGLHQPDEFGHPNYQHPGRTPRHWGPHIDSFSALVIDVGLRGLRADPRLMQYAGGESIVLARSDFADPDSSAAFRDLLASSDPHVVAGATRLRDLCRVAVEQTLVPFAELVSGERVIVAPVQATPAVADPLPKQDFGDAWWNDAAIASAASSAPSRPSTPSFSTPASPAPPTAATSNGAHAPAWAAEPAPPAAPHPGGGSWPTSVPRHVSPFAPAPSSSAPFSSAPSSSAPSSSAPSSTARGGVGTSSTQSGFLGGALGGLAVMLLYAILRPSVSAELQAGLFVGLVGPLVGFSVLATQHVLSGRVARGMGMGLVGSAVGAGASGLGLLIGHPLFRSLVDGEVTGVQRGASTALVWMIVAGLIGVSLGALVSLLAAGWGLVTGALAGCVGGAVFGAMATVERRGLIIEADLITALITVVVAALIGASVGVSRKIGAAAVARVVEGPSAGLEVLIKDNLTIGSAPNAGLRIQHPNVVAQHCVISVVNGGAVVTAHAPIEVEGAAVPTGVTNLPSGATVRIGPVFVRITNREGNG